MPTTPNRLTEAASPSPKRLLFSTSQTPAQTPPFSSCGESFFAFKGNGRTPAKSPMAPAPEGELGPPLLLRRCRCHRKETPALQASTAEQCDADWVILTVEAVPGFRPILASI